jgi:mRNA interferase HigB
MKILRFFKLEEFCLRYRDAQPVLDMWRQRVSEALWRRFSDLRQDYPHADRIGDLIVFNIKGNRYRLVVRVDYENQRVLIEDIMTHEVYDRNAWKGK